MNTLDKLIDSGLYKKDMPLRLHLGCGATHLKNHVNIDFPQDRHNIMQSAADAEADIVYDLNFPKESVDEIKLHHVFEHFARVIALVQLIKWHRWLKVDGVLTIETPDAMTSAVQLGCDNNDYKHKMAVIRHLVGDQAADWAFHRDMWWDQRFETTLSSLGFHITDIVKSKWNHWPYLANITVTAIKLRNISINEQKIVCFDLLHESMVSPKEEKTFQVWKGQLEDLLNGVM